MLQNLDFMSVYDNPQMLSVDAQILTRESHRMNAETPFLIQRGGVLCFKVIKNNCRQIVSK